MKEVTVEKSSVLVLFREKKNTKFAKKSPLFCDLFLGGHRFWTHLSYGGGGGGGGGGSFICDWKETPLANFVVVTNVADSWLRANITIEKMPYFVVVETVADCDWKYVPSLKGSVKLCGRPGCRTVLSIDGCQTAEATPPPVSIQGSVDRPTTSSLYNSRSAEEIAFWFKLPSSQLCGFKATLKYCLKIWSLDLHCNSAWWTT